MQKFGVGIAGFGTVGAGVVEGLLHNRNLIAQRLGAELVLKRVADLDLVTDRGVTLAPELLTTDMMELVADPEIQIVVELIGGTGAAYKFVMAAIDGGKAVVTANKKLLAERGAEIFAYASERGVDLYFGASVGGGIPVVRVLREGLAGNRINSIHGILNGTCNYILTRMEQEGISFDTALAAAQAAGYAEADPSLDVDGGDTAHKAVILASLAFGFHVPVEQVHIEGIRNLSDMDVRFAASLGYRIKLLAVVRRDGAEIEVGAYPVLVPQQHMLASVNREFNAVMLNGDLAGDTLYYGRGAGKGPTASTVIGDICDIARNLIAGQSRYQRGVCIANEGKKQVRPAAEVASRYYLRLMVSDKAGSLGVMTTILGRYGVSILAATQQEGIESPDATAFVPVVMLTHAACSAAVHNALAEIRETGVVSIEPVALRIM